MPARVEVYEVNGPCFFGVADRVKDVLRKVGGKPKVFILHISNLPAMDAIPSCTPNLEAKVRTAQVKRQESRRAGTIEQDAAEVTLKQMLSAGGQLRRGRDGPRRGQDPDCWHARVRGCLESSRRAPSQSGIRSQMLEARRLDPRHPSVMLTMPLATDRIVRTQWMKHR